MVADLAGRADQVTGRRPLAAWYHEAPVKTSSGSGHIDALAPASYTGMCTLRIAMPSSCAGFFLNAPARRSSLNLLHRLGLVERALLALLRSRMPA